MPTFRVWKRDENEQTIVSGLRAAGCDVLHLDSPADLLVGNAGTNFLIEIKNPDKPRSQRQLTKLESDFHRDWRGQIAVAHTLDEALEIIGLK